MGKAITITKLLALLCVMAAALTYPGANFIYQAGARLKEPPPPIKNCCDQMASIKPKAKPPTLSAKSYFVVYLPTYTKVLARNEHEKMYPASTTKMLTALVTRDKLNLNKIVSTKVATTEGQIMGLVAGEKLTVQNLLYGILVHSANDAAYALALDIAPNIGEFMDIVNDKSKALGMSNSYFTNPAGLDEDAQRSTASDLAKAAYILLKDPELKKIVATKSITIIDEDLKTLHTLDNVNELLGEVEGVGGVKTGQTGLAGQNLVTYFKTPYSGHEYIISLMGSEDRFKDTRALIEFLNFNIEYESI